LNTEIPWAFFCCFLLLLLLFPGIIIVIGNDCGQMFTYRIDGPDATYLGDGDLHDARYDDLETFSYFADLQNFQNGQKSYTGLPLSTHHCPYWIRAYPSRRTEKQHQTREPILFMVSTILIFLFTSLVFIIYDVCVERRQVRVVLCCEPFFVPFFFLNDDNIFCYPRGLTTLCYCTK